MGFGQQMPEKGTTLEDISLWSLGHVLQKNLTCQNQQTIILQTEIGWMGFGAKWHV